VTAVFLDASVLVALAWADHVFHQRAQAWFAARASRGWATCPFTRAALVRILSNRAFSPHALAVEDALRLLDLTTKHSGHQFWSDSLSVHEAGSHAQGRVVGISRLRVPI